MSVYNELSAKNLDLLFCAMEWISLYWIGLWSKRAPTRKVLWTSSRWLNRLLYYFCIVPFGLWPRIPLRFKTYWLVRTFKFFPWILPNWFKPSFFFKKRLILARLRGQKKPQENLCDLGKEILQDEPICQETLQEILWFVPK